MSLVLEGNTSLDFWVHAITLRGLYQVKDDLISLFKFAGVSPEKQVQALQDELGLGISKDKLLAAVRRAFVRGLALERKQGYEDSEYTLPAQVFDNPNPTIQTPHFITREFFAELHAKVWEIFDQEIRSLSPCACAFRRCSRSASAVSAPSSCRVTRSRPRSKH